MAVTVRKETGCAEVRLELDSCQGGIRLDLGLNMRCAEPRWGDLGDSWHLRNHW
jgi:hypothetical protein